MKFLVTAAWSIIKKFDVEYISASEKYAVAVADCERQTEEIKLLREKLVTSDAACVELKKQVAFLQEELSKLWERRHNERGAGRKTIDSDVAIQIKRLRSDGYTVRDVADKLGVSIATVSRYSSVT